MDSVTKNYNSMIAESLILEMTRRVDHSVSDIDKDTVQRMYISKASDLLHHKDIGDGLMVHSSANNMTHITTGNGKALHVSVFRRDNSQHVPFDHDYQDFVDQHKDAPHGLARKLVFDHLNTHGFPSQRPMNRRMLGIRCGGSWFRKHCPAGIMYIILATKH